MTDRQRLRALLDQRAQQNRRRDEQTSSSKNNKLVLRRWTGPKRGGSMRGRRSGA